MSFEFTNKGEGSLRTKRRTPRSYSNGLGVCSIILGGASLLTCFLPFGIIFAVIGLLFAALGFLTCLFRGGAGIIYPITGGILCGVHFVLTAAIIGAVIGTSEEQRPIENPPEKPTASKPSLEPEKGNPVGSLVPRGAVSIAVRSVAVGKVEILDIIGRPTTSVDDYLLVAVRLETFDKTKKFEYESWRQAGTAKLIDNFGTRYKLISFGFGDTMVGATTRATLYADKPINDIIVFQKPVPAAKHLTLELSCSNFEGKGAILFRIPRELFTP